MSYNDIRRQLRSVIKHQDADNGWRRFQVSDYPDQAVSGPMELSTFVTDEDGRVAEIVKEGVERDPGAGKFHKLVENTVDEEGKPIRKIWMSDTRAEIQEHYDLFNILDGARHVQGVKVLINGLGLGMVTRGVLTYPNVARVDVVESSLDVIRLISPLITDERVYFYHDDAFNCEWPSRTRWDYIWHDIWPYISDDNIPEMDQLRDKYRKFCHWQGFWRRDGCEAMAKAFRLMENNQLSQKDAWLLLNGIAAWRLDDVKIVDD